MLAIPKFRDSLTRKAALAKISIRLKNRQVHIGEKRCKKPLFTCQNPKIYNGVISLKNT
jgi:hypothetical protein